MIACVLLTALIIVFASSVPKPGIPPEVENPYPDDPVVTDPVTFALPVSGARIGYTYDIETFVPMSVLDRNGMPDYVLFTNVEFIADEGTPVMAVYEGRVVSVEHDICDGTVIMIDHGDGLISVYKYLQTNALVKKGDYVDKGDVIGRIGRTMNLQYYIGAHLCFGFLKDGKAVDPAGYLEYTV